jgi:hypothetical protein
MSEFRVNSITNQDGSAGPQVCGVSTFSGKSGVQIPSGPTEFRRQDGGGRGRGLIGGRYPASPYSTLDFIEIATTGNSQDFGELANQHGFCACFGSNTRAVFAGGYTGGTPYIADISAVTIASEGGSFDFGDIRLAIKQNTGASDRTRGLSFGGAASPNTIFAGINFITIASGGTDQDFGDTILLRRGGKALASPTRAVHQIGGVGTPSYDNTNVIEFVTIQSKGNGVEFGQTTYENSYAGHAGANETRGILAGGYINPANINNIEFLTIATTGNTQDFGDLTSARHGGGMNTSKTRGVMTGSWPGAASNIIDFITIATAGDATDFGDLTYTTYYSDCISDSHGGLA